MFSAAVDWCVKTGTARNLRSARVSMPSQIMKSNNVCALTSACFPFSPIYFETILIAIFIAGKVHYQAIEATARAHCTID